nr:hypothetical protein [Cyanidioschyzonaceae sp. 2]
MLLANLYLVILLIFLLLLNRWLVLSVLSSTDLVQRLVQQKRYATVIAYLGDHPDSKYTSILSYCHRQISDRDSRI